MRTAQVDARGGLRTVWGSFFGNGLIDKPGSSDWTIVRTATGVYVIRFTPPFRSPPTFAFGFTGYVIVGAPAVAADSLQVTVWVANTGSGSDTGAYFEASGRPL
jgi:hypothetical protein